MARWPVSHIFENSMITDKLREGTIVGILVGDSGYACRSYLMSPILKPKNSGEVRYNTAHRRTRCVIERFFGLHVCTDIGMRAALANTLVILMHREQDFDEDIEDEDVPFDIAAAADADGMPNAS